MALVWDRKVKKWVVCRRGGPHGRRGGLKRGRGCSYEDVEDNLIMLYADVTLF